MGAAIFLFALVDIVPIVLVSVGVVLLIRVARSSASRRLPWSAISRWHDYRVSAGALRLARC